MNIVVHFAADHLLYNSHTRFIFFLMRDQLSTSFFIYINIFFFYGNDSGIAYAYYAGTIFLFVWSIESVA
jgi:hypothetical protein